MNGDINIQTQNFDSSKMGGQGVGGPGQMPPSMPMPEQPKKKSSWIIFLLIFVIIVSGAATYYFLTKKTAVTTPEIPAAQPTPQAAAPVVVPTPEDTIDDISSDLNAVDLNALDTQTNSDVQNLGGSL